MGDRRNVQVIYPNGSTIYFYTHWAGDSLAECVAEGLRVGKSRWNDPSYLARVIFDTITREDTGGVTGYGISTEFEYSDYKDDIVLLLSHGEGGRVGIGSPDRSYEEFIETYGKDVLSVP
jgi:hypothetical protein